MTTIGARIRRLVVASPPPAPSQESPPAGAAGPVSATAPPSFWPPTRRTRSVARLRTQGPAPLGRLRAARGLTVDARSVGLRGLGALPVPAAAGVAGRCGHGTGDRLVGPPPLVPWGGHGHDRPRRGARHAGSARALRHRAGQADQPARDVLAADRRECSGVAEPDVRLLARPGHGHRQDRRQPSVRVGRHRRSGRRRNPGHPRLPDLRPAHRPRLRVLPRGGRSQPVGLARDLVPARAPARLRQRLGDDDGQDGRLRHLQGRPHRALGRGCTASCSGPSGCRAGWPWRSSPGSRHSSSPWSAPTSG